MDNEISWLKYIKDMQGYEDENIYIDSPQSYRKIKSKWLNNATIKWNTKNISTCKVEDGMMLYNAMARAASKTSCTISKLIEESINIYMKSGNNLCKDVEDVATDEEIKDLLGVR